MLSPIAAAAAFSIRVTTFVVALGFFPARIVPFSVRFSLILAVLCLLLPSAAVISSGSEFSFLILVSQKTQFINLLSELPYQLMVFEVGLGLLLAVSASAAIYGAEVLAGCVVMLLTDVDEDDTRAVLGSSNSAYRVFKAVFLLLVLYVLFHWVGFSVLVEFLTHSMMIRPYDVVAQTNGAVDVSIALERLSSIAVLAFIFAAAVGLPLFIVSLTVEFLHLLYRRYFPVGFSTSLVPASRAVALVLVLALSVYVYAGEFNSLLRRTLTAERGEQMVEPYVR